MILGAIVGLAYVAYRFHVNGKEKKKLEELRLGNKFDCLDHSKSLSMIILVTILLPVVSIYYFYINYDESMIAFMIATALVFFAEFLNSRQMLKFYYNDTCCIIGDKIVQYKSIKSVFRRVSIPPSRYLILTYNGEQLNVFKQPANIILEKAKLKLTTKQTT